jgi:hypothetical protein
MKVIDKIAFSLWIINIVGIIVHIITIVLYINDIISFDIVKLLYQIIWYPILIFLIYNIWFFYKFDRYSSSIFFLILLNAFYTPFYYYQVKIKKRPLKNKIDKNKAEPVFDKIVVEEEIEGKLD